MTPGHINSDSRLVKCDCEWQSQSKASPSSGSMSDPSWMAVFLWLFWLPHLQQNVLASGEDPTPPFQRIYQSEQTVRRSKSHEMGSYVNKSIDPCVDFYAYACGNWKSSSTPQEQLQQQTDRELLLLLDEAVRREDSVIARQAKEFFKTCVTAQAQQSQQQQQFLSDFITQNGGFPAVPGSQWSVHHHDYNWLSVLGGLRLRYGMDILIGLRVGYNYENVNENSLYLSEPSTIIPSELCTRNRSDIRDTVYEPLELRMASELRTWLALGQEESARLAADILSFEHELCGGMKGGSFDPWDGEEQLYLANYTRKTLSEFSNLFELDLESYVRASYDKEIYKPVFMATPEYFRQLKRTVAAHNISLVANYIMYRAVSALNFPLEDRPHLRKGECLARTKELLPTALGELYARQFDVEDSTTDLDNMYDKLKTALRQSLSAEWLVEGSQRVGQEKLRNLRLQLSSYERPLILKLQLERGNYWHNLRQLLGAVQSQRNNRLSEELTPAPSDPVEAYEARVRLRPVQRRLDMGLALLQPPAYDRHYGHALRYATLGVKLAQQLVMAFDDPHWSIGLLERDNWDGQTAWEYHIRSYCFARQVEHYLRANVSATRELITNSAALNVAFRAYLTWLGFQEPNNDFNKLVKETLPDLDYTNTALFFLAYAQQHCSLEEIHPKDEQWTTEGYLYSARQNHTWTRLQVNGPLRNSADFAREFRCPIGSPMNPAAKCSTY
ncbi:LOW QUALITY PROTEIN: neprilysin-4 [Drosophila eugracilis]|uniref:LOW QUALITY PROTEIN: neprilysin-4 n=1 Tax=Drosophila eugracilis TaxID=29029 RepID=UPI001BDB4573|nr:LOW QUALITY PROTEIN: neprilysin-4 [Drosophila eugracilis]